MSNHSITEKCENYDPTDPANGEKQIYVQLVLSLALGVSAFIGFCVRNSLLKHTDKGLTHIRFFVQDGKASMPREKGRRMARPFCQSFRIASSDGCRFYTG